MCGRVMCRLDPSVIKQLFNTMEFRNQEKYRKSYNSGPMRFLPLAYNLSAPKCKNHKQKSQTRKSAKSQSENSKEEEKEEFKESKENETNGTCGVIIEAMQWGMHRPGTTDLVINGRFEELINKPMFRGLLDRKRCVLMVNGYYEWDESNASKIRPFMIQNEKEGDYLYLACLYNNAFTEKLGDEYNHFVVLTVGASDNIKHIHDRRPVFLDDYTKELWLDPSSKSYEGLKFFEVGDIVNSIKYDNEDCILPKKDYEEKLHSKGLGKYFGKTYKTATNTQPTQQTQDETQPQNISNNENYEEEKRIKIIKDPQTSRKKLSKHNDFEEELKGDIGNQERLQFQNIMDEFRKRTVKEVNENIRKSQEESKVKETEKSDNKGKRKSKNKKSIDEDPRQKRLEFFAKKQQ